MRLVFKVLLFTLLFTLAKVSLAAEADEAVLTKADIGKIKILSKDQDRIHFFLTDTRSNRYRIGNLTSKDAEDILAHLKRDEPLVLKTQPNKRGYRDVVEWRKGP